MPNLIVAAGGAVLRAGETGPQVLIVHRPRYDDWTLPKGKEEPGETPEETALREVAEETGVAARIVAPAGESRYETPDGDKLVRWFAMRALDSSAFASNDEVDGLRWVEISKARDLLSHENDVAVIDRIDSVAVLTTGAFFLVRHAAAGSRSEWDRDDRERPLSNRGRRQAQALVDLLGGRGLERIVSSPYVRCRETVEPLAAALNLDIDVREELSEGAGSKPTRDLIREMLGTNAVLCSHGDVIPALLDWMIRRGMALKSTFDCKKGSTWEVEVKSGEFRKARYLPPPVA